MDIHGQYKCMTSKVALDRCEPSMMSLPKYGVFTLAQEKTIIFWLRHSRAYVLLAIISGPVGPSQACSILSLDLLPTKLGIPMSVHLPKKAMLVPFGI